MELTAKKNDKLKNLNTVLATLEADFAAVNTISLRKRIQKSITRTKAQIDDLLTPNDYMVKKATLKAVKDAKVKAAVDEYKAAVLALKAA